MYQKLKESLWAFIVVNNPDLMFRLQDEYSVVTYLEEKVSKVMPTALKLLETDKPSHAIIELCLNEMTADLKPSRYQYILGLLQSYFSNRHKELAELGTLTYVAVRLVDHCQEVLDKFPFCEKSKESDELSVQMQCMIGDFLLNLEDY
ncbi:hypothetical protein [Sphingobacterium yanglingense]|uniref:Uncharacterized protein n=1 Tax=Sphingobacterium yanglingense TaxID=1437280 RepID=A0A4V6PXB6_9SPHI|nr:hypothetical protein [Sphingobacterium yanglingense]TDQ73813.1 hypothetical protein CLV99_4250 [Sphingobacterium yanglingense]